MNRNEHSLSGEQMESLVVALGHPGYCILDQALPLALASELARECRADTLQGFHPAGTGRQQGHQLDASVRSDEIRWLDAETPASKSYLAFMESLRATLNSRLFLGLFDYECHYARYVPGAFYRKHLDAFAGNRNRVLSTVLYLNEEWPAAAGGELRIYAAGGESVLETVEPLHNRLIVFLSERFPHEVLPTSHVRHSLTGWFRVKGERSWLRPV